MESIAEWAALAFMVLYAIILLGVGCAVGLLALLVWGLKRFHRRQVRKMVRGRHAT